MRIEDLVKQLNLEPHPEGGFYKETYRSAEFILHSALGNKFSGSRNFSTGIYFLLTGTNFSAFHRIKQDEMWHFYTGQTLLVHVIDPFGHYACHKVGLNLNSGEFPQLVVPAGCWFASEIESHSSEDYTLVGCTVAPGFDFEDFELASADELSGLFPEHSSIIRRLTRG
jgi:uncharacterized protein